LYTKHLLQGIQIPRLQIETLFKQVRENVEKASNGKQKPWYNASLTGKFCFGGCDWMPTSLLQKCQAHLNADHLTTGGNGNALDCYKNVLKKYPSNVKALAGLEKIEARYVTWIESFLERELRNKAEQYLEKLRKVNPQSPKLVELEIQLFQFDIARLLLECEIHINADRLTTGESGNALSCYKEVLTKAPNNAQALAGLEKIKVHYVTQIESLLERELPYKAKQDLEKLRLVNPQSPKLAELETRLLQLFFGTDVELGIARLLLECEIHIKAKRLTTGQDGNALDCYKKVLIIAPNNSQALAGLEKIEARYYSHWKKMTSFRRTICSFCFL